MLPCACPVYTSGLTLLPDNWWALHCEAESCPALHNKRWKATGHLDMGHNTIVLRGKKQRRCSSPFQTSLWRIVYLGPISQNFFQHLQTVKTQLTRVQIGHKCTLWKFDQGFANSQSWRKSANLLAGLYIFLSELSSFCHRKSCCGESYNTQL